MTRSLFSTTWSQRVRMPIIQGVLFKRLTSIKPLQWMLLSLAIFIATPASAQVYPEKGRPIKIIVPSGPGSALDLLARTYSKEMTESSGVSAIVENKPGAEGTIGIQAFLATPADGYTMLMLSSSWTVLSPIVNPKLSYDPLKDFIPLVTTSKAGLVMSMSGNSPFKTVREFVAAARANPDKYTCASSSPTLRFACEHLQLSAGIKLLIVPYKTTAAAMLAVASGETDVIFADSGSFISLWQGGRLKGAAYATSERNPSFPNIPTMGEEGMPDFIMTPWYGFYFKPGTPTAMENTMRDILRKAAATKSMKATLKNLVHEPLDLAGSDMLALNRREIEFWSKLVRDRGIKFSD